MARKVTPQTLRGLTEELQKKGLVDLGRPVQDFVTLDSLTRVEGLNIDDPATTLGWYVVGGSSYVIVCE